MESKDYKLTYKYEQTLECIHIAVDDTDHIIFLCPKCNELMNVVKTENAISKVKTTWIFLACHKCKLSGVKKFYWDYLTLGKNQSEWWKGVCRHKTKNEKN